MINLKKPKQSKKTFDQWLAEVNTLVEATYGLGIYDIADLDYRSMFDDGDSPQGAFESVKESIAEEYGEEYGDF